MAYINRDLEDIIKSAYEEYACILITGARQVGKSTVLRQLMDNNREVVLLDDMEERKLASKDPALFLQLHSLPVLIDEVQYAPELFSYINDEEECVSRSKGTLNFLKLSLIFIFAVIPQLYGK